MPDRLPRFRREERASRDGFVLVAVLSVLAFLAFMFAAISLLSKQNVETALLETDSLLADSMLASGIELAGHQLFVLKVDPASIDGQQVRLDDGTITIRVASEAGKVDLNGSVGILLAAAYKVAGLTAMSPDDFAARVMDWRDGDDETRPGGAEIPEYRAGGLSHGPGNAPFRSIDDLKWVLGMSTGDISLMAPYLTVSNPTGKIDPLSAAPELIASLPGLGGNATGLVAQARAATGQDRLFLLRSIFRGFERNVVLGEQLRVFRVRVEARMDMRPIRTVEAVLIASIVSNRSFQITQWRER